MHRKVLALLILLICLAATECGLPPTLRSSEQKDVPLIGEKSNKVTVKQGNNVISSNEAPDINSSPKISNRSTDVQKDDSDDQQKHKAPNTDGTQKENCTKSGMDITKEDNPQRQESSSVQVSIEPSGEESNSKHHTDVAPDEIHKQLKHQNTSPQILQEGFQNGSTHQREEPSETNEQERESLSISASDTKYGTEQQNQNKVLPEASNNGHKEVHPVLITTESKQNKTSALKKHPPNAPQIQIYQATSLKDFHEDLPSDIKQEQKSRQVLKLGLNGGEKLAESLNNLQLLESAKYNEQKQQSSSVVLSEPVHLSAEEHDRASSENPREAGLLDVGLQHSGQISSPEHFVSSSNTKQETNTQEYYDPDLYAGPHISEDLVTTNNALDPKPSVTTYSGFTPSFPVRTAIPQYAVKEDHPDDLAPHHFAVSGHLPYVLDRAKFIQYQQTASRFPYFVRVPIQRNFNVPYPVLVERKAQGFSLPLKVLVHQPVLVQAEDKVLYPSTKPFSFRVHHGTPTSSEDVQDDVGQGRSLSESLGNRQREHS